MKAWILPGLTDVGSMALKDVAAPVAGVGEVVLGVEFAALNPADRYLSIGQYPAKPVFPHVLGRDGVGKVLRVGEGVTGIAVGERRLILRSEVGVSRWGTLAEEVAVEGAMTVAVPEGWTPEEAAAAPLVYVTAWQALTQWGELTGEEVVLVTGASGGVGVATVQLARGMGCRVIGLSRSQEKGEKLKGMGVELIVDPEDGRWRDVVKGHLGKRRVDVAVDNIGGEGFNQILEVMGMFGRVSVVGRLAGPVPSFNTAALFFRRLRIGGVAIGTYTQEESHAAWGKVLGVMGRAGVKPLVDRVVAFGEVKEGFGRLGEGPMGKVVVRVRG